MRVKTNKQQPEMTKSAEIAINNPMTIVQLRESTGLSQSKFAKEFMINKQSICNWEQGIRKAPDYMAFMMQRILWLEEENAKLNEQLSKKSRRKSK